MGPTSKGLPAKHKKTAVRCRENYKMAKILSFRKRNQLPGDQGGVANEIPLVHLSVGQWTLVKAGALSDVKDHTLVGMWRKKSVLHQGRARKMKSGERVAEGVHAPRWSGEASGRAGRKTQPCEAPN